MKAITIVLASALVTAAAIRAAPALAETNSSEIAVSVVNTADLDLTSEAGQRQLDKRLTNAAREVCGTASDFDLEGKNEVRECRDRVLASAREKGEALIAQNQRGGTSAVVAAR
jgi:UrcA family protein